MDKRLRNLQVGLWPFLCLSAGCVSTEIVTGPSSAPAVSVAPVGQLAPGFAVNWTVESVQGNRKYVTTGKSIVSPDGFLKMGPHGTVLVAGLTLEQVRATMTSHAAQTMKNPQVSLNVLNHADGPATAVAAVNPATRVWGGRSVSTLQSTETVRMVPQASGIVPVAFRPEPETGNMAAQADAVQMLPMELPIQPVAASLPDEETPSKKPAAEPASDESARPSASATFMPIGIPAAPICATGPAGAPHELVKTPLPPYVVDIPDILLIESTQGLRDQPISGTHIIRPDGTVSLGIYGSAYVAGMTLDEAKVAVGAVLSQRIKEFKLENLNVDVVAYNSKRYYVITDGGGYGEQVYPFSYTGNETVLDALGQINGIPAVGSKRHIWVARRGSCDTAPCQVLPVDWKAIVQKGCTNTNYQLYPGDRVYVKADPIITVDTVLAKWISPVERLFGVTLLGASTVQTIQQSNAGGNNNNSNGGGGGNNGFNNTLGLFGILGRVPPMP